MDFVAASRWMATHPELALRCLLPKEEPLERRVPLMVAVGTLLSAARDAQRRAHRGAPDGYVVAWLLLAALSRLTTLVKLFVCPGTRVEPSWIRELITTHCQASGAAVDGVLLDAPAERLVIVAELGRDRSVSSHS